MFEPPRVALVRAVQEGRQITSDILVLHLRVGSGYITQDEAVTEYERLLRRVETVQGLAATAQAAVRELSPPTLGALPDDMMLGLAELRTLAAELRRDPTSRTISTEIARVSAEKIGPAAEKWYSTGTGSIGVLTEDTTGCLSTKRVISLGPSNLGVIAAGVEMPPLE
jgi:hypothetical protein